jgi:tripeptidyl-peptidase-1
MRVAAIVGALVVPEPELCCGWEATLGAAKDEKVSFVLEAERQNLDQLEKVALAVSDPSGPAYGQFRTQEQLDQLTAPTPQHVAAIRQFLQRAGVEATETKGRRFEVTTTVQQASELFQTSFRTVANAATGQGKLRAGDYSVPDELAEMVVFGLHGLPLPPKAAPQAGDVAKVTPAVIEAAYGVAGVKPAKGTKNRQAVAEFQGQTMMDSDLTSFFKQFVKGYEVGTDDKVAKFVGDKGEGSAQVEASLDIQYIMGVAPGIPTEFWLYDPNDFCADLKKWTTALLADDDAPLVNSVSYGWQGPLSQIGCSSANSNAVDADLAQLAAKGISIIFASGDSGSGVSGLFKKKLYPSWPASSPWVTSVGATRFVSGAAGEEMASDQFGSGGGFSWDFDRSNATWQESDVSGYQSAAKSAPKFPPSGDFNAKGRGTPDVAAVGEGFQVVVSGSTQSVGGTSASAPTFAGLVSLLNEARLQKGQKQLGFLNPWVYQHSSLFTDITKGTNAIGRGTGPSKYGYECEKGWDAATGLGTPKFAQILGALETTVVV